MEEMRSFFEARVEGYDAHMLSNIEGMADTYAHVANVLPDHMHTLLDLGCGTGLELEGVFSRFPGAKVTGVDMTQAMLDALRAKYAGKQLTLLCGSYFDVEFGESAFDAAVSVQSLHHFNMEEKTPLYARICAALVPGGVYVEADYMAEDAAMRDALFAEKARMMAEMGNPEGFFHFDTPLTVEDQMQAMRMAGFETVRCDKKFGNTAVLVATKRGLCASL